MPLIPTKERYMKLTKKRAIKGSIKKWESLKETGGREYDASEDLENYGTRACLLCEWGYRKDPFDWLCKSCPYKKAFPDACGEDSPFCNWCEADTVEDRKEYASQVLEQLRTL